MAKENESPYGMLISGIIVTKNHYPAKDDRKERYSLDVAVPGSKGQLSVEVPAEMYLGSDEAGILKVRVSYNSFNGKLYFKAIV